MKTHSLLRSCALVAGVLAVLLASTTTPSISVQDPESTAPQESPDAAAIRNVLSRHYVDGLFVERDPDLLRAGLAPTFVMQVYWNESFTTRTLPQWFDRLKLDGVPTEAVIESEIKVLDITGSAGVARVEIHENARHKYTDYFSLYKTGDGWKIVTKTFHAH